MTEIQIRVPAEMTERLYDEVFRRGTHEFVAIALVSRAILKGKLTLLVRHVFTLNERDYFHQPNHGAAWRGASMIPAIQRSMEETLGIVVFHAHDHSGNPALSRDDISSANRLLPIFLKRVPSVPHGSMVLSRNGASGIFIMPDGTITQPQVTLRWFGACMIDWPFANASGLQNSDAFGSQALVFGATGQNKLAKASVAVIGLGGGGSHVVQQLIHLGVGELILIDADRIEKKHRHRLIGATWLDCFLRRKKVDVMRRMAKRIGLGTSLKIVPAFIPHPDAIDALKNADVIVGCVDNLFARADLQQFSWRFLIPYVDIGVSIDDVGDSPLRGARSVCVGGNVITLVPGSFCMWCCGFLSKDKLDLLGDRNYFRHRDGEAQVVSFNGSVASQAVSEVMQLLVGYAGSGNSRPTLHNRLSDRRFFAGFRKLNGASGTMQDWGAIKKDDCAFCMTHLSQGIAEWG